MAPAAKAFRAKVGDLFSVPIAADHSVYGQVVEKAGPQYLVVIFRESSGSMAEAIRAGIDLAGIVFDAKFRNGDWPIVGNMTPVDVKAPWFVLGHERLENLRLENFDRSATRPTTPAEASKHRHRNLSGPFVLQRAAAALHGHDTWQLDFEHFRELGRELSGS